jgi:hypothetical protein
MAKLVVGAGIVVILGLAAFFLGVALCGKAPCPWSVTSGRGTNPRVFAHRRHTPMATDASRV